ncbi:MAG: nucleotidyltransferase family protein [Streptococcaceae bacterium]|nr:nucleotidyltransferase family protein [Streptococcaceae bacterium]
MIDKETEFLNILQQNTELMMIVEEVSKLNLPHWYIAAGSVFQTVWNAQEGKPLMNEVHDIDLVYFDSHLSADESKIADKALENFLSVKFGYQFDVHNEAQMHLWHGTDRLPYTSCENAIERWIATVHAIGITQTQTGLRYFAPYGLDDIFSRTIRPLVHDDITREMYLAKAKKWQERFQGLTVLPWPDDKH